MPSALNPCGHFDRLDQLHGLDVEHRRLRMVAGEAVARRSGRPSRRCRRRPNRAHRFKRVEIEDGQPLFDGGHRRPRVRRRLRLRRAARDVQPPADRVGVDVVRAALAADFRGLEHLVRAWCSSIAVRSRGRRQRRLRRPRIRQVVSSDIPHGRSLTPHRMNSGAFHLASLHIQ